MTSQAIAIDLPDDVIAARDGLIADGTNEILSRTIAQRLLKGDTDL